ncbi:hypothetical protein OAQ99_03080 [Candidatus Kapabacteria bacterium]|nr:hypothetical protein [Candidatus Kapabacteria bacterium]
MKKNRLLLLLLILFNPLYSNLTEVKADKFVSNFANILLNYKMTSYLTNKSLYEMNGYLGWTHKQKERHIDVVLNIENWHPKVKVEKLTLKISSKDTIWFYKFYRHYDDYFIISLDNNSNLFFLKGFEFNTLDLFYENYLKDQTNGRMKMADFMMNFTVITNFENIIIDQKNYVSYKDSLDLPNTYFSYRNQEKRLIYYPRIKRLDEIIIDFANNKLEFETKTLYNESR